MSTILEPSIRAADSSGKPIIGAALTVYLAGTTTPADIYRDASLETPMTNPTTGSDKSGADGYFPQVFADQGQTFDMVCKRPDGTTLWSRLGVPSLGEDTGALTRDFGTGGRLRINGSAGEVRVEGGDPSGDDVGGHITIGGYDGTQAEVVKLDGASVATTGVFTENGKKLQGVVYTTGTVATAATGDIALPNTPTGVRAWDIELIDLTFSAATPSLTAVFSYDGGATYVSSNTYSYLGVDQSVTTQTPFSATATSMALANSISSTGASSPGWKLAGRIRVVTSSTYPTLLESNIVRPGAVPTRHVSAGACSDTLARATNLRLTPSSGTISFIYRVIPLRGFGEA